MNSISPEPTKKSSINSQGRTMISHEETDTEFLVAMPADHIERAERIRPRYRQVSRKRWVYPRKLHMHKALVAEFGKDSNVVDFTHADSIAESK